MELVLRSLIHPLKHILCNAAISDLPCAFWRNRDKKKSHILQYLCIILHILVIKIDKSLQSIREVNLISSKSIVFS